MSETCVIAAGAVSALGTGVGAYRIAPIGEVARTEVVRDGALVAAGFRRPNVARSPLALGSPPSGDRATDLLACALRQLCHDLGRQMPDWRRRRLGVALGTSSGGMLVAERLFDAYAAQRPVAPELAHGATYFAPFCDALRAVGIDVGNGTGWQSSAVSDSVPDDASARPVVAPVCATQVLAACASSTLAIGVGSRWLACGRCDLVLAGGYDALSQFVAAGFESIRATTASVPQPFRLGRDGMALGEGACVLALTRADDTEGVPPLAYVAGFGAADDAAHITAPDRSGAGLIRAARAAVADAAVDVADIGLVSAHGTATPYNDAMEARAIEAVCTGPEQPVVHPFKAQIGHTLGAAGALELLAAVRALQCQAAPAACGRGELDPDAAVRLLERTEPCPLDAALKLSAAFGGVTAALVVTRAPIHREPRATRPVYVRGYAHVRDVERARLAEATGVARDRLARMDDISQLSVGAVAALAAQLGRRQLDGAGVVQGHGLATLDINACFFGRLRDRGPRYVDPRLFPATSPNAAAGHCAIAFGLTGPNFAVGAGLAGSVEALERAAELIAAGDASRLVVLAADDAGPVARRWLESLELAHRDFGRGALALLLDSRPGTEAERAWPLPALPLRSGGAVREAHESGPIGHLALLRWLERHRPRA